MDDRNDELGQLFAAHAPAIRNLMVLCAIALAVVAIFAFGLWNAD